MHGGSPGGESILLIDRRDCCRVSSSSCVAVAVRACSVRARLAHLDAEFHNHFAYVLADMNSRADHLFSFFKAKLLCAHVRWVVAQSPQSPPPPQPEPEPEPEPGAGSCRVQQVTEEVDGSHRIWLSAHEQSTFEALWADLCAELGLRRPLLRPSLPPPATAAALLQPPCRDGTAEGRQGQGWGGGVVPGGAEMGTGVGRAGAGGGSNDGKGHGGDGGDGGGNVGDDDGRGQAAAATADAMRCFNIDPATHTHRPRFSMPALAAHFRRAGALKLQLLLGQQKSGSAVVRDGTR
jgi:hypothetical protein